jgi:hypothetical protein
MAIRLLSIQKIIVLMVVFCIEKLCCLCDGGCGFISLIIQYLKIFFSYKLLFAVKVENLRTVLISQVRALSAGLSRIVNLKKEF